MSEHVSKPRGFAFDLPDGTRRVLDPLFCYLRLRRALAGEALDRLLKEFETGDPGLMEDALGILVPACAAAFRVPFVEDDPEGGLAAGDLIGLLRDFLAYSADLKKTAESAPNSSTTTPGSGPGGGSTASPATASG